MKETKTKEETATCDCCETTWEKSFFCDKCSGLQEDPWWDPINNFDDPEEPDYLLLTVCLNCCNCAASG